MRLSRYCLPILREKPKEAEIVSHRLMLRAGLIRQESAGIYAWLPLGLKVLNKINAIIRDGRPGAKFATLDLIGLPWRIVVGPKDLADGKIELKRRRTGQRENLSPEAAVAHVVAAVKAAQGGSE
ncbi:hypothetical protein DSM21852_09120 [Methylocystis bryophila]|uniref:Anticodon-binding domain-containing protein n=1 Tax=Methylocystis bryophila TaxID=655015 RepID=A0A1W6MVI5_9HYPH|nr:His/Gly/Thr/Pro-type tRNA ligase C-terminal domain-containing protein [Methylocystis bryophila]ARN81618.1 hypothetical protein B1812_11655 [Methylocystis bryophila]BDV37659.1 hypothetical protein DSM21852_09120 [Methylocystis bryophila]